MKSLILFFLLFNVVHAFSQNDTIYLNSKYLVYRGEACNKTNDSNEKTGKWIKYEINSIKIGTIFEIGSGFGEESGMDCHWYTHGEFYVYRPLKTGEKEEERVVTKTRVDTINGSIYYDSDVNVLRSKIAPNSYVITEIGTYLENKKTGVWNYFYNSGAKLKTIDYLKGIPTGSFSILRQDGSVMLQIDKLENTKWQVSKFSEEGVKLKIQLGTLEDFKTLY